MAELVDARPSNSRGATRPGSSPGIPTKAVVAKWLRHRPFKPAIGGSNPLHRTKT